MILQRRLLENIVIILLVCVILMTFAKGALQTSGNAEESYDVAIIMYHAVMEDEGRSGKYVITPDTLKSDIEYLLQEGYTPVFMTDIINFVNSGSTLPEKPIVLTFDDGYYNNYLHAFPITKEYNIKAVFSIIGKYTYLASRSGEKQYESHSHVTWDQLDEMLQSGLWEVQNHTYDMHNTGNGNGLLAVEGQTEQERNEIIRRDVTKLQELIEENLGVVPNTFTYPFGSFDDNTRKLIGELGFDASLSCIEGINNIYKGADLNLLYRYNRPSAVSTEDFFSQILKK